MEGTSQWCHASGRYCGSLQSTPLPCGCLKYDILSTSGYIDPVETWLDYQIVWSQHPWLRIYFAVVVVVLAVALFATFVLRSGPLLILLIPSLGALYAHHLMAMKRRNR